MYMHLLSHSKPEGSINAICGSQPANYNVQNTVPMGKNKKAICAGTMSLTFNFMSVSLETLATLYIALRHLPQPPGWPL